MNDLLATLSTRLHAEQRRDGRQHADCPFCGKEMKRAQKHFSFCDAGYICFVCDAKGSLVALAAHLELGGIYVRPQPQPAQPRAPRQWQTRPDFYLEQFGGAFDRISAWQGYKPLTLDTIARFRLGVGRLPSSRCDQRRLIVPVFDSGQVVAFHGRAFLSGDDDAKWLTSGGSRKDVLYNAHLLTPGATVIICENLVDCLLAMQARDVIAVAGGGVAWRDDWTQQIAASHPQLVLVALDNDLAGWPNEPTRCALLRAWGYEMQARLAAGTIRAMPTPPKPNGPRIASALLAAGVRHVTGPNWPTGTPPKYDLGSDLIREGIAV